MLGPKPRQKGALESKISRNSHLASAQHGTIVFSPRKRGQRLGEKKKINMVASIGGATRSLVGSR